MTYQGRVNSLSKIGLLASGNSYSEMDCNSTHCICCPQELEAQIKKIECEKDILKIPKGHTEATGLLMQDNIKR
jgi:hypothetical protein